MKRSDAINELTAALSKAQGEMKAALKDSENAYLNTSYADLSSVWDACRTPLSKNGLCVIQATEMTSGGLSLITTLAHSSGQWVSGDYPIKSIKDEPPALVSAITYARRCALASIVGVAPDDNPDRTPSRPPLASTQRGPKSAADRKPDPTASIVSPPDRPLSEAQIGRLHAIRGKCGVSEDQLKKYVAEQSGLTSMTQLTQLQYQALCNDLAAGKVKGL